MEIAWHVLLVVGGTARHWVPALLLLGVPALGVWLRHRDPGTPEGW